MKIILSVAAGGAIGAVARYLVMSATGSLMGSSFPWSTLAVNVIGSFILGALVEAMALTWSVGLELRAFLVVGVLGAFTTFSTFSLDVVVLYERGEFGAIAAYMIVSVILSVGALFAGLALVRAVLA
ncbi:MAG: fluoride efflux transporter CrcB [Alphaproteobacteria bacterium]|nr:fluoride efflux transporter CrcB [Alphaproteobacteria bacterium]MCZ6886368.1 fluoride efflux transporter CrcB [Alphaproteobacteria bacterium]